MHRESFRLWGLLRKGSVFAVIFLLVSLSLELQTYLAASATRDVELVWSIPPEQDVAGYNVYYGPVSRYEEGFDEYMYAEEGLGPGDYQLRDPKVHYVLASLDENLTYWVAITAYDHDGNESDYSNEKRISKPSDTASMESSSGGCQSVPASHPSEVGGRAALTGWILLLVGVPAWILRLRKRLS